MGDDREPVAIIGIACRLPGANGPTELWDLLSAGRDAIGEIPGDRFDIDRWFGLPRAHPDRINTRWGGFLSDIDRFDAGFFGISAHEALRLDPQHRLILHSAWEAVEDAGLDIGRLAGSRTGVYTSCLTTDYWDLVRGAGLYDLDSAIGCGAWGMPAARIARLLDLRGPSLGIEAACSSSLVCVHMACRDLWSGQAEQAIVASANLLLTPDLYFGLSESELLSARGRCRFGDLTADGYVRSEGVITVILKPLAAAQRDGDRVYAAILGTGVTNNGATTDSVLATSLISQEEMLRAAYRDADVAYADVGYVEAHGPGTPVGDEIELTALRAVLGAGRTADRPCLVGSVKSNIGHVEAAAGLAGLVKAALAVAHRWIPPSLHVADPQPLLADPDVPLALVTTGTPWPAGPAVAGVSSFGLNATNVHVVLREVEPAKPDEVAGRPPVLILPLSARHPDALAPLAAAYADRLDPGRAGESSSDLLDVCFSAATRRTHHRYRIAATGTDAASLAADLRTFASGGQPEGIVGSPGRADEPPRIVFVFPGQGAQWDGMGSELLATNDTFRDAVERCDAAIRAETGWSSLDLLTGRQAVDGPDVGIDRLQSALFTMQVGLAAVWQGWGIEPDLVIGQSMGEIAASCVTGALSIEGGAAVVCRRGRLIDGLAEPGAMVAVQLGEEQAAEAIGAFAGRVSVGVVSGPNATVLAGEPAALGTVVASLRERGVFCRQVPVRYASHSPQMEPLRAAVVAALAGLRPRSTAVPMHSTVLDRLVDGTELDAGYWAANLREPVRFATAVRAAVGDGRPTVFIEISPHPLLLPAIEDVAADAGVPATVVGSLVREESASVTLARGLAAAYTAGARPAWPHVFPGGRFTPDLPRYPWQTKRFWVNGNRDAGADAVTARPVEPDRNVFTLERPGTADWLSEVGTATAELAGPGVVTLEDVTTTDSVATRGELLRIELSDDPRGWRFAVRIGEGLPGALSAWRLHASGLARVVPLPLATTDMSLDLVRRWCTEPVKHRPTGRIDDLRRRDGESVGAVVADPSGALDLLDVCADALVATIPGAADTIAGPITAAHLRLSGTPATAAWVHARLHHVGPVDGMVVGDVRLIDADHRVVADIRDLRVGRAQNAEQETTIDDPEPEDRFTALLVELLDLSEDEPLDQDAPLSSLGMNSLTATRLRGRLIREFGIEQPIRDLLGPRRVGDLLKDLRDRPRSRSTGTPRT